MKTAAKKADKNPPLYTRKPTGRLVPCPGAAHSNPHIDNCSICAPKWGQVAEVESPLTVEQIVAACAEGFDVSAADMSDDALDTLIAAGVKLVNREERKSWGFVSFLVARIARAS